MELIENTRKYKFKFFIWFIRRHSSATICRMILSTWQIFVDLALIHVFKDFPRPINAIQLTSYFFCVLRSTVYIPTDMTYMISRKIPVTYKFSMEITIVSHCPDKGQYFPLFFLPTLVRRCITITIRFTWYALYRAFP